MKLNKMKVINIEDLDKEDTNDKLKIIFNNSDFLLNEYIIYDCCDYFTIYDSEDDDGIEISINSIDNLIKALNILKEEIEKNG